MKHSVPSDISAENIFIPTENLQSQKNLNLIHDWTKRQDMKINPDKTKYMVINFCTSLKYQTRLYIENSLLEQIKQTKLLGVVLCDDMTWHENTKFITYKAYKRMIILRKLCEFKVSKKDLIQIYILYIRSVLEQSCVLWASSITEQEKVNIERIQKVALRIILQEKYNSYKDALEQTKLPNLEERRENLMLNFARKCVQNPSTSHMFPLNPPKNIRQHEKYKVPHAYTERYKNSAIPAMTRLLNKYANN